MIDIFEVKSIYEIEKVEELANKIWNEHYVPIIGKEQVDYMLAKFQSSQAIKDQIEVGCRYFITTFNGEYAGYFAILPDKSNCKMFLSKLYVDRSFREKGIAARVVSYIEDICKESGLEMIWLTVNKYNMNSIAAYEKMGFVKEAPIVQDIGNGYFMDDYRMEKKL
ncbi:MAG TPA: GNAT family N-acetyltransferase [Clostridiales bacterium]|nr:GNAT family N-acetyltransferase [Clostridiales bacterium]